MPAPWLIANALWLQAGWWICVLGAQRPWLLLLVPGILDACQAARVSTDRYFLEAKQLFELPTGPMKFIGRAVKVG